MACRITITVGAVSMEAKMNDSPTARSICEALPITGNAQTWGNEIYFRIPVVAEPAPDAREEVSVGELGYWPVGQAFCIFFGRTPASDGDEPRAASPVNIIGHVAGDATAFQQVTPGTEIALQETKE